MEQQEKCKDCIQKDKCQEVYQKLGQVKGPSIAFKAIIVFLVPMVVFIAALASFEKTLVNTINTKQLRILTSFLLAFLVTFLVILIIKAVNNKSGKNK